MFVIFWCSYKVFVRLYYAFEITGKYIYLYLSCFFPMENLICNYESIIWMYQEARVAMLKVSSFCFYTYKCICKFMGRRKAIASFYFVVKSYYFQRTSNLQNLFLTICYIIIYFEKCRTRHDFKLS